MSYVSATEKVTAPQFGHAWRAEDETPYATVDLGPFSTITFTSPADARELAAACTQAAAAMEALPEVTP